MTSTGISIVSLRNEGFLTFCLCLTTGCHLGFTEKLRNLQSRLLFANSSWGNDVTAFSLSSQFHVFGCEWYKLYSRKCCILEEGKRLGGKTVGLQYPVWLLRNIDSNIKMRTEPMTYWMFALPWTSFIQAPKVHARWWEVSYIQESWQYLVTVNLHAISSSVGNFYTHVYVYQLMAVCMSLFSTVSLSIIRCYTLHQTGYSHCIHHCHKQWWLEACILPASWDIPELLLW